MLDCKLCHAWSYESLCSDCGKVEKLYHIYGKENVLKVLDSVLVIQKFKDEKNKEEKIEKEEKTKEYNTRSKNEPKK
jgi:spore cortex formation protein SpoVR/YcgB (stage V sporulation)